MEGRCDRCGEPDTRPMEIAGIADDAVKQICDALAPSAWPLPSRRIIDEDGNQGLIDLGITTRVIARPVRAAEVEVECRSIGNDDGVLIRIHAGGYWHLKGAN